jgi:PHP family Zn ribbon phosphoesterase
MGKNKIAIILAVCGLILAGAITFAMRSNVYSSIPELKGHIILLKCSDPNCAFVSEMPAREYYVSVVQEQKRTNSMTNSGLTCKKCGKNTAFRAIKCEKCGNIFFFDSAKFGDFTDRCPKCGFSKKEQDRSKR